MEYIFLEGIVVYADHGVYTEEGALGNKFNLDIKVYGDFSRAKITDKLSDTIDYARIFEIIKEESKSKIHLLEHLANKIITRIEKMDKVEGVELKVKKNSPALEGEVASSGYFIKKVFTK